MSNQQIRDFVFRGLLFDSEADAFRKAGIDVGISVSETEEQLLVESLAPFGVQRRRNALLMGRLYAILHAFENEIRSLITETLDENIGAGWWETDAVPSGVKKIAESRYKTALKDSWLEGSKSDRIEFVDFGDLSAIIIQNWQHFSVIPSQEWLKQRMLELEKCRNFIAHNRMLQDSEFQRIYMYISDWNKVIGL
jgi:hypothetical protein